MSSIIFLINEGFVGQDSKTLKFLYSCRIAVKDLDLRCEQLIKDEFGESCNFDVDDAVHKLEKLGIVSRVRDTFPA